MASLYYTFFLQISLFLTRIAVTIGQISFCDGGKLFIVNDGNCLGGFQFGNRKPSCICVSGVYRSWTKDCKGFDGFTQDYCFPSIDTHDDMNSIQWLKLIPNMSNFSNETFAIMWGNKTDFVGWKPVGPGETDNASSSSFHSINGVASILMKPKERVICVEPAFAQDSQICRYFQSDNADVWIKDEVVRVQVMNSCEIPGYTMVKLKEHRCDSIITGKDSKCKLECELPVLEDVPDSPKDGIIGPVEESLVRKRSVSIQASEETVKHEHSNENFFMHRKLNTFTRLKQVGRIERPVPSEAGPNRTFALLETAQSIVRKFCSREFVSDMFLEQAMDLFVLIHNGQELQYFEDVEERDYAWIQDILLDCRNKQDREKPVGVFEGGRCGGNQLIEKFTKADNPHTVYTTVRGNYHEYHYIIDAIWQIIDMTHLLCYKSFAKSVRMYHVWEQASEQLFTRDIRTLWYEPKVDLTVYSALLSYRAVTDMINLQRCTEAAYKYSGETHELTRPHRVTSYMMRRRREASGDDGNKSLGYNVDVFCAKDAKAVGYNC